MGEPTTTSGAGATPAGPTDPAATVGSTPYSLSTPWGGYGPLVSMGQTYGDANALVTAFGGQNVQIEIQTLTAFATKVEALLAAMEGSEAAPYKLEAQKLTRENFVSGKNPGAFPEAVDLNSAYSKVHSQLVKLHKDFTAQIQAMQKAVVQSAGSYGTSDENAAAAQNAVASSAGVTGPSGSARRDNANL
ncbi:MULTISPECIES: hypothetical protein [Kitasatospora]|uniref:PE domain-containing protein n=1 Tax=Kitasatospora cathayae TaxID=3004092 RepID=A0ABY7Q3S8_9ACTN|nr:hypothetical protein [Kitasatospora sp. HUAS 3-15]WBP87308.1 hypothetical protein O1G21_16635 [Kitasatospora sp. HUAS 3-15]